MKIAVQGRGIMEGDTEKRQKHFRPKMTDNYRPKYTFKKPFTNGHYKRGWPVR